MEAFISVFIVIPLFGFVLNLMVFKSHEKILAKIATYTSGLQFIIAVGYIVIWMAQGSHPINLKEFSIYKSFEYNFYVDLYFDKISATFLFIGSFLTLLVTVYSKYYMHREAGFKRFFNTILFFFFGYNVVIFSGNLETLFIGWEILGVSSFLLIAFYRDRFLPVRNALKVFTFYRIGDVGLILAMWLSHHLFHENIAFYRLNNYDLVHDHLVQHTYLGAAIALMIYISAAVKSAQMPFSFWLPRAMEGPTPSSAIFYGSLSVHIGAFLMMRTFPFWEHQLSIRILVVVIGFITAVFATLSSRVQATVKSQVAYASTAQIGLIFVEISLGWTNFALVHIIGNAFLRMYQLLVSPSIVSYQIQQQFYHFQPRKVTLEDSFPRRIQYGLYILSLKEWNLDYFVQQKIWLPFKQSNRYFLFLNVKNLSALFGLMFLIAVVLFRSEAYIPSGIYKSLPTVFSFIGLLFVVKSFTEDQRIRSSWTLVILNHFWIALAVSFNAHFSLSHIVIYLSGVVCCGIVGFFAIAYLRKREKRISLKNYNGMGEKYNFNAFIFLLACLGIAGFPITPTFIGEDLIFSHIQEKQFFLALFVALSLIMNGLSVLRIYAKVYLGPLVNENMNGGLKSL